MRLNVSSHIQAAALREFGISALLAAVVMFIAAMAMLNQNIAQTRDSYARVERFYSIQKQIDTVNARLTGVEMTVRGYALSGDAAFLWRHRETHNYLTTAMTALGQLTADEPLMRSDYAALKEAVAQHESLYGSLIGNGPDRQDVVVDAIVDPGKRRSMGAAMDALTRLERTDLHLMAQERTTAEQAAQTTYHRAIAIAGLAFLSGTLGFALTFFGKRRASNEHLNPNRAWS